MPCHATNRSSQVVASTAISGSTDVRQLMFTSAAVPTAAQIRDLNFVSELLAISAELTVGGYARADLANVALTEDDANDRTVITGDAPSYGSLAAGETIGGACNYIEGANDGARVILNVDVFNTDPQAPVATNGSPITGPAFTYRMNTA